MSELQTLDTELINYGNVSFFLNQLVTVGSSLSKREFNLVLIL